MTDINNPVCPACRQCMRLLGIVPMRDFDGVLFNREGDYLYCDSCGMVQVKTGLSDSEISSHYAETSLYFAMTGVGVGGDSLEDKERYANIWRFMVARGLTAGHLVDVGCSRGGFIRYLAETNPEMTLCGVDCDARSLKQLVDAGIDAQVGDVFALPLQREVDILSYFHVLEHIYDIDGVLAEATRVLKPQGSLLIEVPDAVRYFLPETYVGSMFWLSMKEHVNHFSPVAIGKILARNGYGIVAIDRSSQLMKGNKCYPSLLLHARRGAETLVPLEMSNDFVKQFSDETLKMRVTARMIAEFEQTPLVFWGIGLEFFSLYSYIAPLLQGKEIKLLDSNPAKQSLTVDGITVNDPSFVPAAGTLICCSYMAKHQILEQAISLGWKRESILCLS